MSILDVTHEYEMQYGIKEEIVYTRFVCPKCTFKGPYWSVWDTACKDMEHHYSLCS